LILLLYIEIFDKYYASLYQSIHGRTKHSIATLIEFQVLSDEDMEMICSSGNKAEIIIDVLIVKFAQENDLLTFCGILDMLLGSEANADAIQMLKIGKDWSNFC